MARITVEDCCEKVPNRYELVLMAANRARAINKGGNATVAPCQDKHTVVALRKIAEGGMPPSDMREALLDALQRKPETDEPEGAIAPRLAATASTLSSSQDKQTADSLIDRPTMTEDELFRAMQSLIPGAPTMRLDGKRAFAPKTRSKPLSHPG